MKPGRKMEVLKLDMLAGESRSISKLAEKYGLSRPNIIHVIRNRFNSARVDNILRQEWGIGVTECRELVSEHKSRMEAGNPVTLNEAFDYMLTIKFRQSQERGVTQSYEEWSAITRPMLYDMYMARYRRMGIAA